MSSKKSSKPPTRAPRVSMSLLMRLVLALVVVGLVPFAVLFYQLDASRAAMVRQFQATHMVAARAAADRVASYLQLHRGLGAAIAIHPDVSSDPASAAAAEALRSYVWPRQDLAAAGIFYVAGDEPVLVQLARRSTDKNAVDEALRPSDERELVVTRSDHQTYVRFLIPLADERLRLLLLARAEAVVDEFVPEELGEEAVLVLGDAEGGVLAGQLASLDAIPDDALRGAALLRSGVGDFELAGERVVIAHADVAASPWFVLSLQPLRVAETVTRDMTRAAWRAFGAVAVVVTLLALAANSTLVKPIRRLAEAQRRLLGSGAAPAAGGEIAELESSIALLERHLYDREALSKVFLGRYQVIDVLGTGAMGTVFRGWDPRLQRYVALKTVKIDDERDERRERLAGSLKKEALTLARLQHPHIVTVFDILEQGAVAFLAMELIEGANLENYVWERTALPADQVVPLGAAIFQALAAAHQQGFVHQDVKPGNVLLGRDGAIKVTDFGIAEILSQAARSRDVVVGTPGFLAPETLLGEGYDEKSDLFAAGVTLYESVTGQHPFPGTNVRQKVLATLRGSVKPPSELGFSVPPRLDKLIVKLMDKDPQARPDNAAAAAAELEELAGQLGCRWKPELGERTNEPYDPATRPAHLSLVATSRVIQ